MSISRVILKKSTEYVDTFTPFLTIESLYVKELLRNNIIESITKLDSKHQALFYQATLEGLQQLQEKFTTDGVVSEAVLDNVEIAILNLNGLLNEHNHQLVTSSSELNSLGKRPIIMQTTLAEKQQLAREYIQFMGGVNLKNEHIMSPKEYRNLLEYTDHLIQFEEIPKGIDRIKPTHISKNHIKYTFYSIHKKLYGTSLIKDVFLYFIIAVFQDFEKEPTFTSLKANFSKKPSSYDKDLKKLVMAE